MKVELLVARDSEPCAKAIALWRSISQYRGHTLTVLPVEDPEGKRLQTQLGLRALPAVLLDGQLVAVGLQSEAQALDLLRCAENGDSA